MNKLFSPARIGPYQLSHRGVMAPLTRMRSDPGYIPGDLMGLDIGPTTIEQFKSEIARAKTVIWNGPLGFFELPEFAHGTLAVGEALANTEGVKSIIGGGDTAAALANAPWASRFTHISTGGGATLEYLEGRVLPGVKALES